MECACSAATPFRAVSVLASINGVTVTQNATDPAGQPAIAVSYAFTGVSETDTTYEIPRLEQSSLKCESREWQ